jgi:uncharacterized protein (AIM24 family)
MAEAGALMYMTPGIEMETVGGDPASKPSGILAKLLSTGQRMLTGEALSMTAFFNAAQGREVVGLAARYPGKLVPLQLSELGGELICPRDALLCVARGVRISVAYQQRSPAGLFSPDGFLMQRVSGDGIAVLTAAGTLLHRKLDAEETLHVDARRLVALLPSVRYDVHSVSEILTASATGEPFLLATLTGPGEIWLQSLPFTHVMVGRPDAE